MSLRQCLLVIFAVAVSAQLPTLRKRTPSVAVYIANLKPIFRSNSTIRGKVVFFANNIAGGITYSGYSTGAEQGLASFNCTGDNACTAALYNGKSCRDLTYQGEHMFVSPIVADPWTGAKYGSDPSGQAIFGGDVSIGISKIIGKPFISKLLIISYFG